MANSSDRNTEAHPFKRPSPENSSSDEGPLAHLSFEPSSTYQSSPDEAPPDEAPPDEAPPAHLSHDQAGPDYSPDYSPDSRTNFT